MRSSSKETVCFGSIGIVMANHGSHPRAFPPIQHLWTYKRFVTLPSILILTSDDSDKDTNGSGDADSSGGNDNMDRGSNKGNNDNDNNHRSSMDMDSNMNMGSNIIHIRSMDMGSNTVRIFHRQQVHSLSEVIQPTPPIK